MYNWFERYFAFSRSELNGICLLGGLLLILWLAATIYPLGTSHRDGDLSAHIAEIEHFLASAEEHKTPERALASARPEAPLMEVEYFVFDPNGLAVVDWKRLGLSERQIRMIKNYEAKGGRFRKREDLKKIYAIHEADYARLAEYIRIADTDYAVSAPSNRPSAQRSRAVADNSERPVLSIDLNAADSIALQRLPGIGPVFASRIVRFRELLGGFYDVSQLMQVYGFDSLRFDGLSDHVYVDTLDVKKIAINAADYEQLRSHPFITHKLANAIVQYRKQHGPYQSLTDLLNIAIMDNGIFRKIVPYLTISND